MVENLAKDVIGKRWLSKSKLFVGSRWDNGYHAFHKGSFFDGWSNECDLTPLGEIIEDTSYGILTPGNVYSPEHPITYVRVTDMRTQMEVDFEQTLKVPEEYYRHERAHVKQNDILLAVKGASIASNKSVAFIEKAPARAIVNGTIFRFQVRKPNNPIYIAIMLDGKFVKSQIRKLQISNNAVSYLDKPSIFGLQIPLPSPTIQDQIVTGFLQDLASAKRLRAEAESLLTEAKIHVERIVLGREYIM